MKSIFKHTLLASAICILTACGGGGGGGGSVPTVNKYTGTHSYCDGDHTRYRNIISDLGNGNLSVSPLEITYQNSNCTGAILATYSESIPSTMTFIDNSNATVRLPGLPSSLNIDKFKATVPNTKASLIGTGVVGNCVNYPGGRFCYDLEVLSKNVDVGFYMINSGFYGMILENGVYVGYANEFYTRE